MHLFGFKSGMPLLTWYPPLLHQRLEADWGSWRKLKKEDVTDDSLEISGLKISGVVDLKVVSES